jgi:hypothetical protein
MDISLGMQYGLGNTASAVGNGVSAHQADEEKNPSGGASTEASTTPATRESASERPVRENGESDRLTREEQTEVRELQKRDREVRAHEAAHRAAAGGLASGGSYSYTLGPDGRSYAVAGEVSIRMPATENPRERLRQAETVRRAAMAPADPSPQDRQVAAQASAMAAQARGEIQAEQRQQMSENQEKAAAEDESGISSKISAIGQRAISSFQSVGSVASLHSSHSSIDEMI